MTASFDFVSTEDKPALIAFSTPEWMDTAKTALRELGFKVHTAATHSDFLVRFNQVRYQVVIIEELFAANNFEENLTLQALQTMPVSQRRRALAWKRHSVFRCRLGQACPQPRRAPRYLGSGAPTRYRSGTRSGPDDPA